MQRFAVRAERSDRGTSAAESLDALLEITDSVISYRQRYSITATRSSVVDLVALDPNNPRSLAFQASRLVEHLQALSDQSPEEVPAEPLSQAILLSAQLCAARASQLDESRFADFDAALLSLSDAIARTYLVDRSRLARPIDADVMRRSCATRSRSRAATSTPSRCASPATHSGCCRLPRRRRGS